MFLSNSHGHAEMDYHFWPSMTYEKLAVLESLNEFHYEIS